MEQMALAHVAGDRLQRRTWGSWYLSCIQVENTINSQGAPLV